MPNLNCYEYTETKYLVSIAHSAKNEAYEMRRKTLYIAQV